ncbi:hypothetical protein DACRYDRAFT_22640 [Dacryopinax primogenitus]|uniref:Uncharacterized protein n=1 Tax=Dacryopinax primogenitus (strain DJM 731) TaxID=1858805 RepID=M5FUT8_DACPD|nr:uncharacterized protein DACRYDRAFT_22640 [Dacryopinax primogenitus]EJU01531.1 hypothetical protein DACRYDRAFT_22640 [Dacryopinax primogenitus]
MLLGLLLLLLLMLLLLLLHALYILRDNDLTLLRRHLCDLGVHSQQLWWYGETLLMG